MRSHTLGQKIVRAGCQIDRTPRQVLLSQILQQWLVIRQMSHIERRNLRDMALERSPALQNPRRKLQQRARTLPRRNHHCIQQRVALDQRSIQIHAQRYAL